MAQTGERLVRTNPYVPEAAPAEPDDKRVVFLLDAYPDYDARRWVQSMVGWRRKAAEYEAERERLRAAIEEYILWQPGRAGHAQAHHRLVAALNQERGPDDGR